MKNTTLLTLIAIVTFACGNENNNSKKNAISGNISNITTGTEVFLAHISSTSIVPKDTATIDDKGNYSFNKPIEELGYYRLMINDLNFINLILCQRL